MAQDTTEEEPAHPGCQSTGAGWEISWREGPSLVPVGGREEEGSGKPLRRRASHARQMKAFLAEGTA